MKETWSDFDRIKDMYFGDATQRAGNNSAYILDAKRQIFYYVVFGHTFNYSPNFGISRDFPRMDFLVTLRDSRWHARRIGVNE